MSGIKLMGSGAGGGGAGTGTAAPVIASVNPTAVDDSGDGYAVGQPWVNSTTGECFELVDATLNAATWRSTTARGTAYLTIPRVAEIGPEDFLGSGSGAFNTRTAGTGPTITFAAAYAGGAGFISGNPGSSAATGFAAVGCPTTGSIASKFVLGVGITIFDSIWAIPTLSDATDTVIFHTGLFSNVTASGAGESPHAVSLRYTDAVNGGRLLCVAATSSVETTADSGVTVTAGVLYHTRIEVNAAGSSVKFYVGAAGAAPSLVATITTNIPTTTASPVGPSTYMTRVAGTNARSFDLDVQYAGVFFTTSR